MLLRGVFGTLGQPLQLEVDCGQPRSARAQRGMQRQRNAAELVERLELVYRLHSGGGIKASERHQPEANLHMCPWSDTACYAPCE